MTLETPVAEFKQEDRISCQHAAERLVDIAHVLTAGARGPITQNA